MSVSLSDLVGNLRGMTPRASRRRVRTLCALVATGALAVALGQAEPAAATPKSPVDLQLLSFNDYHGHLQPPTGSDGVVINPDASTTPAGGVEYLSTHLAQLRQGHRNSLTVAAGDLIGGSPFLSGLFKDEPSVESLNQLVGEWEMAVAFPGAPPMGGATTTFE